MNMTKSLPRSDIRIAAMASKNSLTGKILATVGPLLDRLLGIRAMRRIYEEDNLMGLAPQEFARQVTKSIGVEVHVQHQAATSIPATGPVLVVCNHPYGGMEAVVLMDELLKVRHDVKVFGNKMLRVFCELNDVLIHTNPLVSSQQNLASLRQANKQLDSGGVLVVFPAGRVSYFRKDLGRTTDHPWNRIVGHLIAKSDATVVPTFIEGSNSRLFLALGYVYSRLKILLLPREMLKLNNKRMAITMGQPIRSSEFSDIDVEESTYFARMMTYLQGVEKSLPPPKTTADEQLPLADKPDTDEIEREIAGLPPAQVLLTYRDYVVCYARQDQAPATVHEIARQRERTFRLFEEGSGQSIDGDKFDAHYVHLFVWNQQKNELLGAYRLGHTDHLRTIDRLYLSEMFDFDDAFYTEYKASLELGRSFVTPEYQKTHYSLHILWKGIGAYLRRHPQYDRLYGTVSLSRQYELKSICVMCDALIDPTNSVAPKSALDTNLGAEWSDYKQHAGELGIEEIARVVRSLEKGERDIPVLLRHYHKVGAKFLAVGVDRNFNNTPGLLLSVDLHRLPARKRKLYVDDNKSSAGIASAQ